MKFQESRDDAAVEYQPLRDELVALRTFTFNGRAYGSGDPLDTKGADLPRLQAMIRTKFVGVVTGKKGKVASPDRSAAANDAEPVADKSAKPGAYACDRCTRFFSNKTKLGAHKRVHKAK